MKVAVTGGTGFVGSHSVAALLEAGHEVKLLVRSPERIKPALEPLGVGDVEHVVGDVTDVASVVKLLEGCDAVLHGASVYSLDPRQAKVIRATNVAGTEAVLGAAIERGLDPVVHVSSVAALIGEPDKVLDRDSLPTTPPSTYARSKADSERVARRFQDGGKPVVTTYPGQVLGPHDPLWGEGPLLIEGALGGKFALAPKGRVPISDVRDVARLHAALMEPGKGPRRYVAPCVNLDGPGLLGALNTVTGRNLKTRAIPYGMVYLPLKGMDVLQKVTPFRMPLDSESIYFFTRRHTTDSTATEQELGITARPIEETLEDMIRWMLETGKLKPKLAGKLAG